MTPDIFLIAPDTIKITDLEAALGAGQIAACLLLRGDLSESDYETWARTAIPIVQAFETAAILDGDAALAIKLQADGAHLNLPAKAFKSAAAELKAKSMIAGAGGLQSRHEAMTAGEAGADYVWFGPLKGNASDESREMAEWWAETFEIPSVLADPTTDLAAIESGPCEFLALGEAVWTHKSGPAAAITQITKQLGTAA